MLSSQFRWCEFVTSRRSDELGGVICTPAATLCVCACVVLAEGSALHQRSPKTAALAKSSKLFKSPRRACFVALMYLS